MKSEMEPEMKSLRFKIDNSLNLKKPTKGKNEYHHKSQLC